MKTLTIVDYGVGNILGIRRAFEHCGATVTMASDAEAIRTADRLLLPGVGAFGQAAGQLRACGMFDAVRDWARLERPLMGICLGMQLLCSASEEFGQHLGLDLINGNVVPVPAEGANGVQHKIPHIGWTELTPAGGRTSFEGTVLEGVASADCVYFVHSFMAVTTDPADTIASATYDGVAIPAVIGRDAIVGCQFHPEKSGETGLGLIRRFLEI
jgi:glutamine amidotransferase